MEGQKIHINDLKSELISAILSYLTTKELARTLLVCKFWNSSAHKFPPFQWRRANVYHIKADALEAFKEQHKMLKELIFMRQFNAELLESVLRLFPEIEHLSLSIHNVPKYCCELTHLKSFQAEGRIPAVLLKKMAKACHYSLTELNLSRDKELPDDERLIPGLTFVKEFAKLTTLNLQGCKGDGLQYVLQNCAMMRHLNLGFMSISNIHCQLIGGNMFHLRSLVLRSTEVTDDGLYEIGLGCKKLERVFLENCKKIGAQGVVDLIANCTEITALKFAGCTQLRDDTIFALSG